jgi:hypothetical protein
MAFLNDAIAYVSDPYWWLPKGITWQHMADARAAVRFLLNCIFRPFKRLAFSDVCWHWS